MYIDFKIQTLPTLWHTSDHRCRRCPSWEVRGPRFHTPPLPAAADVPRLLVLQKVGRNESDRSMTWRVLVHYVVGDVTSTGTLCGG